MAISGFFIPLWPEIKVRMEQFVGREAEVALLQRLKHEQKSAFVAIYGRRRVGKTYMVRRVFDARFAFYFTGTANANTARQLQNFHIELSLLQPENKKLEAPNNWFEALRRLATYLSTLPDGRKVIFLDELPWLDSPKSGFIQALEYFWNSWASARTDILLITCGSAASWMIHNLINHHGGLHNRVTHRLEIEPFTLREAEQFFEMKGIFNRDRYQMLQLYMAMGGIPWYMEQVEPGQTASEAIQEMCFSKNGLLRTEFDNLYHSLFRKADLHLKLIETMAQKNKGMTRSELAQLSGFTLGGNLSRVLNELEQSGFIRKYNAFGNKSRESTYQVCDFYSLFYLRFIRASSKLDQVNWLTMLDKPEVRAWSGYAFEQVCLQHILQIKQALGIAGINTSSSIWYGKGVHKNAQIDLLIDRRDHAINLCEIKFSMHSYSIDKSEAEQLREKIAVFKEVTGTKKAIIPTYITTYGLKPTPHAGGLVQKALEMGALFN